MSQPFFIRAADKAPLTLAGIWDRWIGRDGEVVESCAIVTQPSRPPADAIHDRMPLALERDAWERWLDPTVTEIDAVTSMLAPRAPRLIVQAVSPHVNDPRHDDARCLEPWQPGQGELFS